MRVRKNVKDLSLGEKQAFLRALLALKKQPSRLKSQGPSQSRYDDYVEIHRQAGWAHNGPAFLPWYRVVLLSLEHDLAAIDPRVTLPYWDWTDRESSPFTADFLGGNGDPQDHWIVKDGPFAIDGPSAARAVRREFADSQPIPLALPTAIHVTEVLKTTPYEKAPYRGADGGFRARLEIELCNLVRRWVGGTMITETAPDDPAFFLHHANVDRLWHSWQQSHRGIAPCLPLSGAPPGHNFDDPLFFIENGLTLSVGPYHSADLMDIRALGYHYDCSFDARLRLRSPASDVKTLWNMTYDAPGAWIDTQGHIHHGGGGPGDMVWAKLSPAVRDEYTGRAIIELAALISNAEIHAQIARAASALVTQPKSGLGSSRVSLASRGST